MAYKKTLLLDFDAVLHQYTGWNNGVLGKPMEGARKACYLLERDFKLVCFTTRAAEPAQLQAVEGWLTQYGFPKMRVTATKEPAFLQVDDRVVLFAGVWNDELITAIRNFQPYWELNRKDPAAAQ